MTLKIPTQVTWGSVLALQTGAGGWLDEEVVTGCPTS